MVGENGQLVGDYQHHALWHGHGDRNRREVIPASAAPTIPPVLHAFEAFMRGHSPNPIPLREGIAAVAAADRCYELAARRLT